MIIGAYVTSTYIIDSFHVIVYLYYRYLYYKHLQMIVDTYLEQDSRVIGSHLCTHILASLPYKSYI